MPRPVGVTILAILYFISTCFLALMGVASIAGLGFLGTMLSQNPDVGEGGAAIIAGAGVLFAVIFLAFAVLCGFVGYGLLKLRPWGRTIAMVLAILDGALGSLALIFAIFRFAPLGFIINGVRVGIDVLIIWYLNQPHVKAAFAIGGMPPVGVAPPAGIAR
ncbi:MAG: hypothetical protein L0Z53_23425 [Acidobacteriales bacterium]|nr:hypothetical protein [Terriglobales bacterium]